MDDVTTRKTGGSSTDVAIPSGGESLPGVLVVPERPLGLVLFAHGSGSSRHSPRNILVSGRLKEAGFATLLFDLLTQDEERLDLLTATHRFDIPLLSARLQDATDWVSRWQDTRSLRIGYFGASTGAAAALVAAAAMGRGVKAVVCRGGRPDLAEKALARVSAATLLIVGGQDEAVLRLNEAAVESLRCPKQLSVVPGATHLFDEPGALEEVARLAIGWFVRRLARRGA
ncbi:MAG TPA: dienelactone hydrolase family protein [Candidatus Polarisedimenticolia bacterium]|nr:dienelactone hydrolase family protein [Candidatus Polarisedimenticolia bacterium]